MLTQDFSAAKRYIGQLIKKKLRSRRQIIDLLYKEGFASSIVEEMLVYLDKEGLINDSRLAEMLVYSCIGRGWGINRINNDLEELGIDIKSKEEALKSNLKLYNNKLTELIKSRLKAYQDKPDTYNRVVNYLLSRGFSQEEVANQLKDLGYTQIEIL